jgi:predicted ATP-grasp superfamily ATP-dependent carboligase
LRRYEHAAVIIGGGITGLQLIRNIGRHGVDIYCVTENRNAAIYSKYCRKSYVLAKVEHDRNELDLFLTHVRRQLSCSPVIFPTADSTVLNLAHLKSRRKDCIIPLANEKVLKTLIMKREFYRTLAEMGIPHPRTANARAANPGDIEAIPFPVFVKPSFSQSFAEGFGKKGFVANTQSELVRYLRTSEKEGIDVLIQEIIPGPPTNHYFVEGYLDENCRPLATFARRRLRMWPLPFGNSSLSVSVSISQVHDMKESIFGLLTRIGYHGIFSAEFKVDPRDGHAKLLEVNARGWWYNSLSAKCGVNIILTAYLDAIGEKTATVETYRTGCYAINFMDDVRSSALMFTRRRLSLRDWIHPMTRDVDWAMFSKDDPRPSALSILDHII